MLRVASIFIFTVLWFPANVVEAVDMCPSGWTHYYWTSYGIGGRHGNYCYKQGSGSKNYDSANSWCETQGTHSHIMTIHSAQENLVQKGYCPGTSRCWTGFSNIKSGLLTVDKRKFYRASSNPSGDPTGWSTVQGGTLDTHNRNDNGSPKVFGGNGPWWGADGSIGRGNDNFGGNIASYVSCRFVVYCIAPSRSHPRSGVDGNHEL